MRERRLIPLVNVRSVPVSWLWANRIPLGTISILEGDPGQGKSAITCDLAARCTRGLPMPNCTGSRPPAGVIREYGVELDR